MSPGLESGDADENGDSPELTMAPPLHTPPSRSEKYASIRRSNLTRVNLTTPPTTPVDNNTPGKKLLYTVSIAKRSPNSDKQTIERL